MNNIKGVVGLDLSVTSTGFSRIDLIQGLQETCRFGTKAGYGDMKDRQEYIVAQVSEKTMFDDLFIIENSSFASRNSIFILAELAGVIKYTIYNELSKNILLVAPTTLKKWATGKGQGKKDQIRLGVYKKYNKEFKTDDEIDAFVLADIGLQLIASTRELKKYEIECLNSIKKGKDNLATIERLELNKSVKIIKRTVRNIT